jgi:hypothetical protein
VAPVIALHELTAGQQFAAGGRGGRRAAAAAAKAVDAPPTIIRPAAAAAGRHRAHCSRSAAETGTKEAPLEKRAVVSVVD